MCLIISNNYFNRINTRKSIQKKGLNYHHTFEFLQEYVQY